jgi:hypothetical protein
MVAVVNLLRARFYSLPMSPPKVLVALEAGMNLGSCGHSGVHRLGKTHGPAITEHVFAPMSAHHETKLPSLLRANLRHRGCNPPKNRQAAN